MLAQQLSYILRLSETQIPVNMIKIRESPHQKDRTYVRSSGLFEVVLVRFILAFVQLIFDLVMIEIDPKQ